MRRERRKAYFPTEDLPTRNFTKAACALKFYTHSHFLRNILEGWCRRKDAAQKELPARISLECSSDGERHPLRHFLNNSCVGICSVQTRTLVHSDELTSVRKIVFRTLLFRTLFAFLGPKSRARKFCKNRSFLKISRENRKHKLKTVVLIILAKNGSR